MVQDLLNLGGGAPSAAPAASSSGFDPLGSLSDSSFGAPPAASSAPAFPTITAFSKDGVSVSFAFSKPPGQPSVTDISATYTNSDAAPVTGFSLQVLQHSPACSSSFVLLPGTAICGWCIPCESPGLCTEITPPAAQVGHTCTRTALSACSTPVYSDCL